MASDDRWIVIPNWQKFQQYKDRDPIFIKDYREQLSRDEYRQLSFHRRGILQGLRLSYAASNGQLRDNTLTLTRQLGQRVLRRDLEALNDAGLIRFRASKPLALTRSREKTPKGVSKEKSARAQAAKPPARSPQEKKDRPQDGAYKPNPDTRTDPVPIDPAMVAFARGWLDRG